MVTEIDLWIVLPLCILGFMVWAGLYVYITLTIMRVDPREQKYRKDSGKSLGVLPKELTPSKNKEERA